MSRLTSIRWLVTCAWTAGFVLLTARAVKAGRNSKATSLLMQAYYGYDPFVKRGILTGLIYAVLDGYIAGMIAERVVRRHAEKN